MRLVYAWTDLGINQVVRIRPDASHDQSSSCVKFSEESLFLIQLVPLSLDCPIDCIVANNGGMDLCSVGWLILLQCKWENGGGGKGGSFYLNLLCCFWASFFMFPVHLIRWLTGTWRVLSFPHLSVSGVFVVSVL